MSIYSDLLERVDRGAKYNINLVDKTLKIDGKEIALEGNLIDINEGSFIYEHPWETLEALYFSYKRSVTSEKSNGNKPFFKAVNAEELTDNEIAFNLSRNYCQAALEGYVLLAGLSGWLTWNNDNHWFWQSDKDKELVVLREWI